MLKYYLNASAAALAITILSPAVHAQAEPQAAGEEQAPAEAEEAPESGEIVVTARRREENIQSVPIAISAFQEETLDRMGVEDAQGLNRLAPGLQVDAGSGGRSGGRFTIRGQGANPGGGGPGVVSYFADVAEFQSAFFDLENLQILKGPQGTLFGRNTTGGAVLFVPKKPTNEFTGYLQGSVGSYNYRQLEGAVGGAIIDDVLLVRLSGQMRQRNGFTTALGGIGSTPTAPLSIDLDDVNTSNIRLSILFRPTASIENTLMFVHAASKTNGSGITLGGVLDRCTVSPNPPGTVQGAPGVITTPSAACNQPFQDLIPSAAVQSQYGIIAGGRTYYQILLDTLAEQLARGPSITYTALQSQAETRFRGVINTTTFDISDNLTLKNIFSLRQSDRRGASGNITIGTNVPVLTLLPLITNGKYLRGNRVLTEELQLQGDIFDGKLDFILGGYYEKTSLAKDFSVQRIQNTLNETNTISNSESSSKAIFGQATYEIADQFHLTAGLRQTWDYRRSISGNSTPTGVPVGALVTGSGKYSKLTYTFTADWAPVDNVLLYATARRGYKAGGFNTAGGGGISQQFDPETVDDYEIGAKTSFDLGGGIHARINGNLFYDDYQDIQRSTVDPLTSLRLVQNIAAAKIKGGEIEFSLSFSPWFELGGYYGYTDAKFTDWTECTSVVAGVCVATRDNTVNLVQGVSKHRWALNPQIHLNALDADWADITLGANLYYQSKFAGIDLNAFTPGTVLPSRTLLDLRADWRNIGGTAFNLSGIITNVKNKRAPVGISDGSSRGTVGVLYNEPRMAWLTLSYNF